MARSHVPDAGDIVWISFLNRDHSAERHLSVRSGRAVVLAQGRSTVWKPRTRQQAALVRRRKRPVRIPPISLGPARVAFRCVQNGRSV